jgi:hypothetical protein
MQTGCGHDDRPALVQALVDAEPGDIVLVRNDREAEIAWLGLVELGKTGVEIHVAPPRAGAAQTPLPAAQPAPRPVGSEREIPEAGLLALRPDDPRVRDAVQELSRGLQDIVKRRAQRERHKRGAVVDQPAK